MSCLFTKFYILLFISLILYNLDAKIRIQTYKISVLKEKFEGKFVKGVFVARFTCIQLLPVKYLSVCKQFRNLFFLSLIWFSTLFSIFLAILCLFYLYFVSILLKNQVQNTFFVVKINKNYIFFIENCLNGEFSLRRFTLKKNFYLVGCFFCLI